MNTGHDGSMGTIHANHPSDACIRLEMLCLLSDTKIPADLIRRMIAGALHIIVQCHRYSDGKRRISEISELVGVSAKGEYETKKIFEWVQKSKDDQGQLIGEMVPCQYLPSFFSEIVVNKLPLTAKQFSAPDWIKQLHATKKIAS
jgi:pilus assembly protein CpaF